MLLIEPDWVPLNTVAEPDDSSEPISNGVVALPLRFMSWLVPLPRLMATAGLPYIVLEVPPFMRIRTLPEPKLIAPVKPVQVPETLQR